MSRQCTVKADIFRSIRTSWSIIEAVREISQNKAYKIYYISHQQFGFREGVSAQDVVIVLMSEMYDALDRSKSSQCIFMDFS